MRKWYVFDRYDCFDSFATVGEAAILAADLADVGVDSTETVDDYANEGVHIAYMNEAEFESYCKTGKFPFAK